MILKKLLLHQHLQNVSYLWWRPRPEVPSVVGLYGQSRRFFQNRNKSIKIAWFCVEFIKNEGISQNNRLTMNVVC